MKSVPRYTSLLAVALCLTAAANAQLLTNADQTQLESWLGQGNLTFTNIYTMKPGDTTADFHTAVDRSGPTFVLMDISGNGGLGAFSLANQVVGGYNPQSWNADITNFTLTTNDAERNAFIFNLSSDRIQRENLNGQGLPQQDEAQTYNAWNNGPTFGGGFDLTAGYNPYNKAIPYDGSLGTGIAYNYSYGGGTAGYSGGQDIIDGGNNYFSGNSGDLFYVNAIEVYTFTVTPDSSVPDASSTVELLSGALIGLAALRRLPCRKVSLT